MKKLLNKFKFFLSSSSGIVIVFYFILIIPHLCILPNLNPGKNLPSQPNLNSPEIPETVNNGVNGIQNQPLTQSNKYIDFLKNTTKNVLKFITSIWELVVGIGASAIFIVGNAIVKRKSFRKRIWYFKYSKELNSYKLFLKNNFNKIILPFSEGVDLPMSSVYIPISLSKIDSINSAEYFNTNISIQELLNSDGNNIIIGSPGSGKSVLCEYIMYNYASEVDYFKMNDIIPVFFRFADILFENKTKFQCQDIVDKLKEFKFDYDLDLLVEKYEKNKFILIFDGFDEVPYKSKENAIAYVKSIQKAKVIITCRATVYDGQFDSFCNNRIYEIQDFNYQQIHSYISNYPFPDLNRISNLQSEVYSNLRIKILSKNPLMLSLICFLVLKENKKLPAYRGDFYEQSIKHLLNKKLLKFQSVNGKPLDLSMAINVLKRVAIYIFSDNQINSDKVISFDNIINLVKEELGVGFENDANVFFANIIQPTSILIQIDKSNKLYQFAHLTIQEYFVALSMKDDSETLFLKIKDNKNKYIEISKIWSNISSVESLNKSRFLERLNDIDHLLALECLIECSDKIDSTITKLIVTPFLNSYKYDESNFVRIKYAFALIISSKSSNNFGKELFVDFCNMIEKSSDETELYFLADVFATSLNRDCLQVLVNTIKIHPKLINVLISMEDLAVQPLYSMSQEGNSDAVYCLKCIGTDLAIDKLTALIWSDNSSIAYAASLSLSMLLGTEKEQLLYNRVISPKDKELPSLDWVWKPFDENESSSLFYIANRLGYILSSQNINPVQNYFYSNVDRKIDQRLAIPIVIESDYQGKYYDEFVDDSIKQDLKNLFALKIKPNKEMWININKSSDYSNIFYSFRNSEELYVIIMLLIVNILLLYMLFVAVESILLFSIVILFLTAFYVLFIFSFNKKVFKKPKKSISNIGIVHYPIELIVYSFLVISLLLLNIFNFIIDNSNLLNWLFIFALDLILPCVLFTKLCSIENELNSMNPIRSILNLSRQKQ
jgi:hypothetical protein